MVTIIKEWLFEHNNYRKDDCIMNETDIWSQSTKIYISACMDCKRGDCW